MNDSVHVKTAIEFRSPLSVGELYWAGGKLKILKEILRNAANWRINFIYQFVDVSHYHNRITLCNIS